MTHPSTVLPKAAVNDSPRFAGNVWRVEFPWLHNSSQRLFTAVVRAHITWNVNNVLNPEARQNNVYSAHTAKKTRPHDNGQLFNGV
jgi:hypothetical protein